ncbi:MAG: ABC transporter substrate-binding protein [Rubrobacteraceae bacterium]
MHAKTYAVLLAALAMTLSACAGGPSGSQSGGEPKDSTSGDEEASIYPVTVTDSLGREVTIDSEPENIASMAPSVTETLFEVGAGEKVVGVTTADTYPEEVREIEKIGDFQQVNVEKLLELETDLLFHSYDSTTREVAEDLEEQTNADVVVVNPQTLDDVVAGMELVGRTAGEPERGRELEQELRSDLEEIVEAVEGEPEPTVFYEVFNDPLQTVGPGSFIHDALELAGGENIAADTNKAYPTYSAETLIEKDPEYYFIGESVGITPEDVAERPGYSSLTAVEEGNVIAVDDVSLSRPGPRITEAAREVAEEMHPEAFE